MIRMCAWCKKIVVDDEYVESNLIVLDLEISYGICPACSEKQLEELQEKNELIIENSLLKLKMEKAQKELDRLTKQNTNSSWKTNPDRMGGQFSDEEINDTRYY